MNSKNQNHTQNNSHDLLQDITRGLLYTHTRINANTTRNLEAASFLYALIELLSEKEILSIEELDERKKQVAGRLVRKFVESKIGLLYQYPECDKYTFKHETDIDCESRRHICRAICCKFPFALSRQDVEEGAFRWEFSRPYLIAHDDDGYCVHLDRESYRCMVWKQRPVPCHGFDCEDNEKWKVWKDFVEMVINDGMIKQIDDSNEKIYTDQKLNNND